MRSRGAEAEPASLREGASGPSDSLRAWGGAKRARCITVQLGCRSPKIPPFPPLAKEGWGDLLERCSSRSILREQYWGQARTIPFGQLARWGLGVDGIWWPAGLCGLKATMCGDRVDDHGLVNQRRLPHRAAARVTQRGLGFGAAPAQVHEGQGGTGQPLSAATPPRASEWTTPAPSSSAGWGASRAR
jgi:hypothetical protein